MIGAGAGAKRFYLAEPEILLQVPEPWLIARRALVAVCI